MKRLTIMGFIVGTILVAAVCAFGAAVPQVINYSGTLTNKLGVVVPDGPVDIEFTIYNVPSAGTALWTERWSSTAIPSSPVLVTGGVFNVMLGTISPFPNSFFADNPNTYLGIKVGADSEMLPRQKIASVGYSFAAGNGVPKGGVIMWSGATTAIPEGWALCDGTNGTPNLRDRFVVGAGSVYSVGATGGESTHVLTSNEMPSHTHAQNAHTHTQDAHQHTLPKGGSTANVSGIYYAGDDSSPGGTNPTNSTVATNQNTTAINQNTGSGQAHNTLPPYYALAFIMKL